MNLYAALHQDHERLDALFEELLNRVHVDDREGAQACWSRFERALLGHLEAEEQSMLPVFDREDKREADAIREEHEKIRALVAELGAGLEIHVVREETVERFVRFLREHAAREEKRLYRWADQGLAEASRASLLERLRQAWGGAGSSVL